ncbi:OmpA family protein [Erythrobacter rubeus]|uniref:OmpA family protein n=1 Tax=Erythrobacter rubeus TaxID=2760803 RepID=A0ABR8KM65_9SPHN|nr:OmpA family protein [Erythrobacter rubeus]MBD2840719.1 OmpA family protein [Erythrobacter rubeus]
MNIISNTPKALILPAMLLAAAPVSIAAQDGAVDADVADQRVLTTVTGTPPGDLSGLTDGPEIEGLITARNDNQIQVTGEDGTTTVLILGPSTKIKSSGGFLGLDRDTLSSDMLLNGLPIKAETVQWGRGLVASEIDLKSRDLRTAAIVRGGTSQQFAEQGAAIGDNKVAIGENKAATEALRGRFGAIDQYNIKGTTNVYFDTGKFNLSNQARTELCTAASEAESLDNALLLVVGYTDSTGSYEINQELSEKRAGRVVNYLQQQCGWKPWRMLTPTGLAESDPAASNDTAEGKAQNRRVAVNILVSKSVEGLQNN